MICEKCGATLAESRKFCSKCGAKIEPVPAGGAEEKAAQKRVAVWASQAKKIVSRRKDDAAGGLDQLVDLYLQEPVRRKIEAALSLLAELDPGFELADDPFTVTEEEMKGTWLAERAYMFGEDLAAAGVDSEMKVRYLDGNVSLVDMRIGADNETHYIKGVSRWRVKDGRLQTSLGTSGDDDSLSFISRDRKKVFDYSPGDLGMGTVIRKVSDEVSTDDAVCLRLVGSWEPKGDGSYLLELYRDGHWSYTTPLVSWSHAEGVSWQMLDTHVVCSFSDEFEEATGFDALSFKLSPQGDALELEGTKLKFVKEGSRAHQRAKVGNRIKGIGKGFAEGVFEGILGI